MSFEDLVKVKHPYTDRVAVMREAMAKAQQREQQICNTLCICETAV